MEMYDVIFSNIHGKMCPKFDLIGLYILNQVRLDHQSTQINEKTVVSLVEIQPERAPDFILC